MTQWSQNTDLTAALSRLVLGSDPTDPSRLQRRVVVVDLDKKSESDSKAKDELLDFVLTSAVPFSRSGQSAHALATEPFLKYLKENGWQSTVRENTISIHNLPSSADQKALGDFLSARFSGVVDIVITENYGALVTLQTPADCDALLKNSPISPNPFDSPNLLVTEPFQLPSKRHFKNFQNTPEVSKHFKISSQAPEDSLMVYDSIAIANFTEFVGLPITLEKTRTIVSKLALFHPIDKAIFPIDNTGDSKAPSHAFVRFAPGKNVGFDVLKCLYFLGGLTYEKLSEFKASDIQDLQHCTVAASEISSSPTFDVTISQKKHNQHVHHILSRPFVTNVDGDPSNHFVTTEQAEQIAAGFLKSVNYQETNVYVNQLPLIFKNNDDLWCEFWAQIGRGQVKSAKIIKPQFYSKKTDSSAGKFGFVFYEEFKSALRAIILTNGRVLSIDKEPKITVSASFALQKRVSGSGSAGRPHKPSFGGDKPEHFNHFRQHTNSRPINPNSPSFAPMPVDNYYMEPYYGPPPTHPFNGYPSEMFMPQNMFYGFPPYGPPPSQFGYYMMPYQDASDVSGDSPNENESKSKEK